MKPKTRPKRGCPPWMKRSLQLKNLELHALQHTVDDPFPQERARLRASAPYGWCLEFGDICKQFYSLVI